jgi:putative glycosyltransferase
MPDNEQISLSIVTTIYKSSSFLPEFIDNSIKTLNEINEPSFEMIFVLDGITDNSLSYLLERKKNIPQIKIVELSRNFGHHYAASAGLKLSKGNLIFIIDCDLEVMPEILIQFKQELIDNPQYDVIYGYQSKRKGGFIEKKFGGLFWKLFNSLSDVKIPKNIITERLMTRRYLDALLSLGDKNLFMAGMMYWVGYQQKGIEVQKKKRAGKSSYGFYKRLNLFFEAITSFSEKPLKLIFYFGLIISLLSVFVSLLLIIHKIMYPDAVLMGYTSMVLLILFSLGIIILSIGMTGIYLARVFKQVQDRPIYIIKSIIE